MKKLKKFLCIDCTRCNDIGHLMLRVAVPAMMLTHGFPKLMSYSERADSFPDPLGVGSPVSMALTVFAEFFCALALGLGIGTRVFAIPLSITMFVAAFVVHAGDPFKERELALMYLVCFIYFAVTGGGKYSLDTVICKKCKD